MDGRWQMTDGSFWSELAICHRPSAIDLVTRPEPSRTLILAVHADSPLTASPPAEDPAPELLRSAQAGDAAAQEALARWCYPRVARWALIRTGDPDEADDITQEVVMRLPQTLNSFAGRSRFSTWLYRVTANTASAGQRRSRRRLTLLGRQPGPEPADEEQRQIAALHGADVMRLVRSLLTTLPQQQRAVFDLADLQGYDAADIAAMLELEPVTVRSHLMRARRAMRAQMLARVPGLGERQ